MTGHLTAEEFIDALEASLASARSQHLDACERCRAQFAELQHVAAGVRTGGTVPEPSPLFWDHFSARVQAAVGEVPAGRAVWWQRSWRPIATVAGVMVAALLAVSVRPDLGLRRAEDPNPTTVGSTADAPANVAVADEESLNFVAAAVPYEELQQMARPSGDATDAMVTQLTAEQREELVRLLKAEKGSLP